jgi:uncharacterized protein YyaL (SSP411 family)
LPRHPLPSLLWLALDQAGDDAARSWVALTLDAMRRGGIRDQLDRGFHRCARDERWVTPHFEKPVPLNAHLAAVYARAATSLGRPDLRDEAAELVTFCEAAVRHDVDAIGADTPYSTWTSDEVLASVQRADLQPLSLHYGIVPGSRRQALHQAVRREDLGKFTYVPVEELTASLDRGRRQLLAARRQRPHPELVRVPALAWLAETIRWLLRASRFDVAVSREVVTQSLERLTANPGATGYARADGSVALADQVSILAALLEAREATEEERWRERAAALGETIIRRHLAGPGLPTLDVIDAEVPATVATLAEGLTRLADLTGEPGGLTHAQRLRATRAPAACAAGPWAASFWTTREP